MEDALPGTIRIGYVRGLLDYLNHHQLPTGTIFTSATLHTLDGPPFNKRVSIQEWGELLQRATTHTQDDQLPLRVGAGLTPKHIGVFAYVAMTCKNLAEVILLLERYESLMEETNFQQNHHPGPSGRIS